MKNKFNRIYKEYLDELSDDEYFAFFEEVKREKYGENEFRLYFMD